MPRSTVVQHMTLEYTRSEEHTSELQSQSNLVCRLLLEKKNAATHSKSPPMLSSWTYEPAQFKRKHSCATFTDSHTATLISPSTLPDSPRLPITVTRSS